MAPAWSNPIGKYIGHPDAEADADADAEEEAEAADAAACGPAASTPTAFASTNPSTSAIPHIFASIPAKLTPHAR
jgi:hypothetical protein